MSEFTLNTDSSDFMPRSSHANFEEDTPADYGRPLLPLVQYKPVSCGNCIGACCRQGLTLSLSQEEADFLEGSGTEMVEYPGSLAHKIAVRLGAHRLYTLQTDCGNLEINLDSGQALCAAYEDSRRPEICAKFEAGSAACRIIRVAKGVDSPAELARYDAATS